jgi:predicted NUDIX family phosphoesterase
VETDFNWKQLIPYHVIRWGEYFYHYTRGKGKGQGEQRLHGKRSIGIGGHINSGDGSYIDGAARELEEEVCIYGPKGNLVFGYINDNSNSVGRVHIGVVHLVTVQAPLITPREEDMLFAGFTPLDDISTYEVWSQIFLKALQCNPNLLK